MRAFVCGWVWIAGAALVLGGCGDDSGASPTTLTDVAAEAAGDNCAGGGVRLSLGGDANGDGVLDEDEVDSVEYICDASAQGDGASSGAGDGDGDGAGGVGTPGGAASALVAVMELAPGSDDCPEGGVAILDGADDDGDGVLDASEVESTTSICGAGLGAATLVVTEVVAAGDDCAHGGIRVARGADDNGNASLDADEVDGESFLCNGAPADPAMGCAFPATWDADGAACVIGGSFAGADLTGRDISHTYLAGTDFSGADLTDADLSWTELRGADFTGADLTGADLTNALVDDVDFTDARLDGADLTGVDLRDPSSLDGLTASGLVACPEDLPGSWSCVDLGSAGLTLLGPGSTLSGLDLTGADLSGFDLEGTQVTDLAGCPADLPPNWQCLDLGAAGNTLVGPGANLDGLDFTGADFGSADLRDVSLVGANLSGALLAGTDMDGVRAFDLVTCPQTLPGDWSCESFTETGNTLVGPGADLSGLDLSGEDLSSTVLDDADLSGANLGGADLGGVSLDGADLDNADLGGADLAGASLDGADLQNADLAGADLAGASLDGADLQDADLAGANLDGADLSDADLQDVDLTGATLIGADLNGGTDLDGATLAGVTATELLGCTGNLPGGWDCVQDGGITFVLVGPEAALGGIALDLSGSDLSGADLIDADLSGADLTNATIDGIDASGVDLTGADLTGADLADSDFRDANLTDATLDQADLDNTDLRGATLTGVTATDLANCPPGGELPADWSCIADNVGNDLLIGPGADLGGISLDLSNGPDLSGENLAGIDLTGADLTGTDLSGADLTNADLTDADLTNADLTGATITGATLTGVTWNNTVCPSGTNSDSNGNTCP